MDLSLLPALHWWQWLIVILFLLLLATLFYARLNAAGSRNEPLEAILHPGQPGTRELVVFVHGYIFGIKAMAQVMEAIRGVRPDADILLFGYPSQAFSNADPFCVAWQMESEIDEYQTKNQYEQITLSGFSMGALLVRKAYVYGCGNLADAPVSGGTRATTRPARDWTAKVNRLVLLAGVNRGWSRDSKPKDAPFGKRQMIWLGITIGRLSRTGFLIRRCEKGEPFVANLRLQWLEIMRRAEVAPPTVIQLLGDTDDVVDTHDSKDVTVARTFIWVSVSNTGHANMIRLADEGTGLERKEKIQLAFGNAEAVAQLKRMNPVTVLDEDRSVQTAVFVLHGIRDMGEWTSQFEKPLQDAYGRKNPESDAKLYVHRAAYRYFGMGPFLLWADRQKNVRWFMDEVTELTARFPNLREIHFIGHSNGTYVLASALQNYATLKVKRAALAGSVIRRDFPWSHFSGRLESVRNYVGAGDWVVGLLPRLFELPLFNFFNKDIGSAGFNGFQDGFARPMETQFVKGAHGAALHRDNIQSIVDFVIEGKKTEVESLFAPAHPAVLAFFSNVCWILWVIAAVLLIIGAWKVPELGAALVHWFSPASSISPEAIAWCARGSYVFLLWLLLNTL